MNFIYCMTDPSMLNMEIFYFNTLEELFNIDCIKNFRKYEKFIEYFIMPFINADYLCIRYGDIFNIKELPIGMFDHKFKFNKIPVKK